ncbi:Gfo/Idh/MocA family oxidoreductase [Providencia vermicola]|uniref:Gfo/Idh/MocA family protein n=1 Tax=Providencia vermicola TaxID=333965 RepID=UPI0032DBE136
MNNIAVIGLGNIASRHRRNLKFLFPDAKIYAMSASGRIPAENISDCDKLVTSIDELILEDVQFVIIASPATFHSLHAIPLIKENIPVLIEKPVTSTLKDAKKLQEIADKYSTPIAVGYCLRYLTSAQAIKKIIEAQQIGSLSYVNIEIGQYLPDWRPDKDYRSCVSANSKLGGGALLELSHEIDYTQWLLGTLHLQYAILQCSEQLNLDVEDNVNILATTSDNTIVNIHLDFLQRKAYRHCRFVGTTGSLEWDLIKNEIILTTQNQITTLYSEPEWDKNNMYLKMLLDFIEKINGRKNQSVTLSESIKTIQFIENIKKNHPITMISK